MTDLSLQQSDDAEKLRALRELLPATGAGIYLDTATFGPLPAEAAEAMRQADDWELRVGRITAGREEDVGQRAEEARAVIAALLGGQPGQVVLARGVEEALDLARRALDAPLEIVRHVSAIDGALTPLAGLGEHTADHGTRPILDATLSAGAIPLSVEQLDVDGVVLAADRWLLGPEGTAALWLRQRPAALVHAPTLPRTTLVGLARSVGWLEMYVGLEWLYERTARLAARLRSRLASIPQLDVPTPDPPPAAIVAFRMAAWPAQAAADELGRRVFALLRPLPEQELLRASVGWFNTEEEIDRFTDAVATLAEHTPDSLPRRPPLIVR